MQLKKFIHKFGKEITELEVLLEAYNGKTILVFYNDYKDIAPILRNLYDYDNPNLRVVLSLSEVTYHSGLIRFCSRCRPEKFAGMKSDCYCIIKGV